MTTLLKNPILVDCPMPITTPRIILRPVMPGDGTDMHTAKMETWDHLTQWMPWTTEKSTAEDDEILARNAYAKFIRREDLMMVGIERETNKPVIYTGLHRFDWSTRTFEIGFWVRKSAQGNGYATECTGALIRYAFNALNANCVEIFHAVNNKASQNVIEKLGFTHEATRTKATLLPNGELADRAEYVRLNDANLPHLDVTW